MRKPLIRLPLTALLLWLAWLGGSQWWETMSDDNDWTDDYVRSTATIVGSRAEYWSNPGTRGTWTCVFIVEWQHQDRSYRSEPIWLNARIADHRTTDDCGKARFGETVPVWIAGVDAAEPFILEPGNRTAKPGTGIINLAQALLFLGLAVLLWRPRRKVTDNINGEDDAQRR